MIFYVRSGQVFSFISLQYAEHCVYVYVYVFASTVFICIFNRLDEIEKVKELLLFYC